jgi:hypothetical protein
MVVNSPRAKDYDGLGERRGSLKLGGKDRAKIWGTCYVGRGAHSCTSCRQGTENNKKFLSVAVDGTRDDVGDDARSLAR